MIAKAVFAHYIQNINPNKLSAEILANLTSCYINLASKSRGLSQRDIEKVVLNVIHELADRSVVDKTVTVEANDFITELNRFKNKYSLNVPKARIVER